MSTSRNKKILIIYSVVFAVLTLVCTAVRTAAVMTCYDRSIGYYETGALLPKVGVALSVFAVLLVLSLPIVLGKGDTAALNKFAYSPLTQISSACYAVVLLFCSFYMALGSYYSTEVGVMEMLILAFGIIGAMYFVLVTAGKVYSTNTNNALFAYAFIFFILMVIAKTYFDYTTPMNGSNKIFFHISLMAAMLYMLTETRFILGNRAPRAYNAASLVAVFFSLSTSVHGIVGFIIGELTKPIYFGGSVALLGFSAYVITRYISYLKKIK